MVRQQHPSLSPDGDNAKRSEQRNGDPNSWLPVIGDTKYLQDFRSGWR